MFARLAAVARAGQVAAGPQRRRRLTRCLGSASEAPPAAATAAAATKVLVIDRHGYLDAIAGTVGESLFDMAARGSDMSNHIECACAGKMLCSTCHVYIVDEPKGMPPATEEEKDMIDLAFEPTDQSRLGCQIRLRPLSDGILKVKIPAGTVNHFR